jgi:LPXTG-motif cell wall-anchored protein
LKKVMLVAAMLAMVLAAAVPALAQNTVQENEANVACVQTAVQTQVGVTQIAASQYGDATNINIQAISQECNITVSQVNNVVNNIVNVDHGKKFFFDDHGKKVFFHKATASASATASATASASSAPAAVQYQYAAPEVQYSASASSAPAAELPSTGGSSLIALGAGVLLVAGGLLARRIVR